MTHVKGRRVYLSGPMTGIKDWNRDEFNRAERAIRSYGGVVVYNPTSRTDGFNLRGYSHAECMRESIRSLCSIFNRFHVLVLLPGWENSAGAKVERTVAEACGIEVCDLEDVVA